MPAAGFGHFLEQFDIEADIEIDLGIPNKKQIVPILIVTQCSADVKCVFPVDGEVVVDESDRRHKPPDTTIFLVVDPKRPER